MSDHRFAPVFGLLLAVTLVVPAAAGRQDPVRVGGAVKEPKRLVRVDPVYPATALAANVEGQVIIEATIDREGKVTNARVLRGGALFDEAAVAAVRQWTYEPSQLNGVPVEVLMTVVVNFKLDARAPTTPEELLNQRLVATPADADAMISLARIYRETGRLDAAARMLERALDQVKSEAASDMVMSRVPGAPLRVGGAIKEPKRISAPDPVYPRDARNANVSGMVIIEATIAKDGTVKGARVLRGDALFDAAALDAVRKWIYEPTMLNGEPVEVVLTVTIRFQVGLY